MLKIRKHYKTILATITVILLLLSLLFIGLTANKALSTDEMNMAASAGTINPNAVADSTEVEPYVKNDVVKTYGEYTIDCKFNAVNAAFWKPDYFEYIIVVSRNSRLDALDGLELMVEFHDSVENPVRRESLDMSNIKETSGRFETAANLIEKMVVILTVHDEQIYTHEFVI